LSDEVLGLHVVNDVMSQRPARWLQPL